MTNQQIWEKVEELRARHETLRADKIPLDLISFVELDLRLDLIPYDRLKEDFGADAAILADFSGFYIDGEIYDRIDLVRGAQLNRSQTAELIAPRFGVHPIAIETRFDREGIWPSPF